VKDIGIHGKGRNGHRKGGQYEVVSLGITTKTVDTGDKLNFGKSQSGWVA